MTMVTPTITHPIKAITNTTCTDPNNYWKMWESPNTLTVTTNTSNIDDWLKEILGTSKASIKSQKPMPKSIDVNGDYTTVHWTDGTHTVVKRADDEPNNLYAAFCAALAKKLYGSTSEVHRMCEEVETSRVEKRKEEERKRRIEAQRKKEALAHERKVRRLAREMARAEEVKRYYEAHKDEFLK